MWLRVPSLGGIGVPVFRRSFLAYHTAVERTYPQARYPVVVEVNDVFVTYFFHEEFGRTVRTSSCPKPREGFGSRDAIT